MNNRTDTLSPDPNELWPDAAESESATPTQKPGRPDRLGFRLMLAIALLFIVAIGVLLYQIGFQNNDPDEPAGGITQTEQAIAALRTDLEARIESANQALVKNQAGLVELKEISTMHGEDIVALRQKLEGLATDIESLRQGFRDLEQAKTQQAAAVQAQEKKTRTPVRRSRPRRKTVDAPFDLVSIDSWGGNPSVVIRANGGLHTLEQNASLEGWTVERIDAASGAVTLRDRSGQTKRITEGRD